MNDAPPKIHAQMLAILADLPAIGKTSRNEQQKFMFRSHDAVLNALNPLLAKHGVFVVPDIIGRITAHRQTGRGSTMYEVNLHVRFTFYADDGSSVSASTWGEGTDMGDKATNKAMTMAFKAVLAQAFAVSTEEQQDTDAHTPEETTQRRGSGLPGYDDEPDPPKPAFSEPDPTEEQKARFIEVAGRAHEAEHVTLEALQSAVGWKAPWPALANLLSGPKMEELTGRLVRHRDSILEREKALAEQAATAAENDRA